MIIGSSNSPGLLNTSNNVALGFRGEASGGCSISIGAEAIATAENTHVYGCYSSNTGFNSAVYGSGIESSGSNTYIFHNHILK